MTNCTFRVWDNGDMSDCGKLAAYDGNRPRCAEHAKSEIEVYDEEIEHFCALIKSRRVRQSQLRKALGIESEIVKPQPAPKNADDAKPIWPIIIEEFQIEAAELFRSNSPRHVPRYDALRLLVVDMTQRHEFGVAKYGVPLVADNARDHLADALQEVLDCVVYLRSEIEKRGGFTHVPSKHSALVELTRIYMRQCEIAIELRGLIHERDGR